MKTCLVSVCGVFEGKEEKGRGNHLRQERHGITLGCGKGPLGNSNKDRRETGL